MWINITKVHNIAWNCSKWRDWNGLHLEEGQSNPNTVTYCQGLAHKEPIRWQHQYYVTPESFCPMSYKIKKEIGQNNTVATSSELRRNKTLIPHGNEPSDGET